MAKSKHTDPKSRAWGLFLAAHASLIEQIEAALAAASLPPLGWYDVLWELEKAEGGRLRMHELAQRIVLTRSNLTRLADRLEAAGLVAREDCPEDRRGYFLTLTDQGKATRARMWPVYRAEVDRLFARHLSAAAADTMGQAFSAMLRAARPPDGA